MRIIILGAGRVGFTVANNLSNENIDITLIDKSQQVIDTVCERLDISAICGNVSHPDVLESAGMKHADIVIAATDSDETNMMACQVAHHLFNVPKKIARVRAKIFLDVQEKLFNNNAIPIDAIINPENEIVQFIKNLILHPGSQQVLSFANGALSLVETRCNRDCALIGKSLNNLSNQLQSIYARIALIYRQEKIIIPHHQTVIEENDRVFFIADSKDIQRVLSVLFNQDKAYKRLIIAGGGRIGLGLAKELESTLQVKIITKSNEKAFELSEQLDHSIVLAGDATDEAFLLDENIDKTDVFCTLTSDDETNILCSMLAKSLGAKVVMSLVDRNAYMSMVDNGSLDNVIYPQHTTIGKILSQVRQGGISSVHSLLRGKAEAFEAVVKSNGKKNDLDGKAIGDIKLPSGSLIIGIVRDGVSLPAKKDVVIKNGDHLIIFIADKSLIHQVEALFQPTKSLLGRLIR
ncbi:MAG: Trk system potassium transporter TrkA [Cycloclasticus sp.]|nr:Trk system potassium transporter TrkA [Cycloclasticus sp.]MBG96015.1 Trk system potassium transporter TrkA [Cycloclasticus sp.]HAI96133.1 Trk system potassium transporter TrkA [Methylococcaceae bacterium]|tara:strand:- start:199 stop:1590 length:1392 start_codon:yes stop_codon:yes gene_type:complete